MEIGQALDISAAGLAAETSRLRVIAENLANQDSTAATPDAEPYRRKTISFATRMDRALGIPTVRVARIGRDPAAFPQRYDPGHPAADAQGYVRTPNVNSFVELMDMREAERSYSANLAVLQTTRGMLERTIGLLK